MTTLRNRLEAALVNSSATALAGATCAIFCWSLSGCQTTDRLEAAPDASPVGDAATLEHVQQALVPTEAVEEIGTLKGKDAPELGNIEWFVRDRKQAIALGKALFWDQQAGSDGIQACGVCHSNAGADARRKNQLNPGTRHTEADVIPPTFTTMASGGSGGPNYTLVDSDFPFHQLADPADRNSVVLFDSDDVVGSAGLALRDFNSVTKGQAVDDCDIVNDDLFHVGGLNVRQTTPRNVPTMINAIFNKRTMWDGRGNAIFNGVDPFGLRNPDAKIYVADGSGNISPLQIALGSGGPGSQTVGPAPDSVEMSCRNRKFSDIGRKLLWTRPLKTQMVDKTDSVHAEFRHSTGLGLNHEYARYVRKAFYPKYWKSGNDVDGYQLIEANFNLFWGIAIHLYEATLVSDQTPFDEFLQGKHGALSEQQRDGLDVFVGEGQCIDCHSSPLLSDASVFAAERKGLVRRIAMADGGTALVDTGFANIGVRPTKEDIGLGGNDPWGNPISFSAQLVEVANGGTTVDPF
ncbi:MAG: cytochrome c peroxidase, partial [Myxococcota bacterium]